MKKEIILLLMMLLWVTSVSSQPSQKGSVREFNSGKKPIAGVAIQFLGAISTESDMKGRFDLKFTNSKKDGDPITFVDAKKTGYEVVNEKQLESLRLSADGILPTDLILAKAGVIKAAKAEFAGASIKVLTEEYEREKAMLLKKVNDAQIKEEEYNEQIRLLRIEFERQEKHLDELAKVFARVNFDDISEAYKEALNLYKEGKLDEAINRLESENLGKQIRDILLEEKRLGRAKEQMKYQEQIFNQKKNEQIEMLLSLVDMYQLKFKPLKSKGIIDTLLLLDTTDIRILVKAADFYRVQSSSALMLIVNSKFKEHPKAEEWRTTFIQSHTEALSFYQKILAHPEAKPSRRANSHSAIGNLYATMGKSDMALLHFEKNYEIYLNLLRKDSSIFNKSNFSISNQWLGDIYSTLGDYSKSLQFYQKYNDLKKELYEANPKNERIKMGLAISYSKLGDIYTSLNSLNKALESYQAFNNHAKELYDAFPNIANVKNLLASSYINLAEVFKNTDIDKAIENAELAVKHYSELIIISPESGLYNHNHSIITKKLRRLKRLK